MNATVVLPGRRSRVERVTSVCLIACLLAFIGTRLTFAIWWPLHLVEFFLSTIAVIALTASFWLPAQSSIWRIAVILYASATQLVPMVIREPILLLPILGATIPLIIVFGCLLALSKKESHRREPPTS